MTYSDKGKEGEDGHDNCGGISFHSLLDHCLDSSIGVSLNDFGLFRRLVILLAQDDVFKLSTFRSFCSLWSSRLYSLVKVFVVYSLRILE